MKIQLLIWKFSTYYPKNYDLSTSQTFYFRDLTKTILPQSNRKNPAFKAQELTFGTQNTEHMLQILSDKGIWSKPQIRPFDYLKIHPFNSTFHYGIECYEGFKAYKDSKGLIRLFRPQCNMKRFKETSKRISLPDFDGNELLKCIEQLVRIDNRWIPSIPGCSLYIRPFHISMENILGIKSPSKSNLLVVLSPVGAYYRTGFNPISILCNEKYIRSAPGGMGGYKVGGNYGPTIKIAQKQQVKDINSFFGFLMAKLEKQELRIYSLYQKKVIKDKQQHLYQKILFFLVLLETPSSNFQDPKTLLSLKELS